MHSVMKRLINIAVCAITTSRIGLGAALAADIPPLQGPTQAPPEYNNPPAQGAYPYPPPAVYAYPPPAYYYGPPAVAVAPAPFYPGRYYGGAWGYAPYRGYGYRGHRRW